MNTTFMHTVIFNLMLPVKTVLTAKYVLSLISTKLEVNRMY